MTQEGKYALRGMILGDGSIRKNGNSYEFSCSHCEKQKDYILSKAEYLSSIFGKPVICHPYKNNGYNSFRFSISNKYLKWIYKRVYKPKKFITLKFLRQLSDISIAYWYMDDGSLIAKKRNGKIHAYELVLSTYCSESEVEAIIAFFIERYGIVFTKKRNKGLFSIRCGTHAARRLLIHLIPYIHPCMYYKVFPIVTGCT